MVRILRNDLWKSRDLLYHTRTANVVESIRSHCLKASNRAVHEVREEYRVISSPPRYKADFHECTWWTRSRFQGGKIASWVYNSTRLIVCILHPNVLRRGQLPSANFVSALRWKVPFESSETVRCWIWFPMWESSPAKTIHGTEQLQKNDSGEHRSGIWLKVRKGDIFQSEVVRAWIVYKR